jgi:hypothetical protein
MNDPFNTEDYLRNIRSTQPDPGDMQAGGGFTREQVSETAAQMNYDEYQQQSAQMAELEAGRAERAAKASAEAEQRVITTQIAAAQVARSIYDRAQASNPQEQMERFKIESARTKEFAAQRGVKGEYRQYDPVMGTFSAGRPSDFNPDMAGRVTSIKQAAGIGAMGERLVTPIFETAAYKGTGRRVSLEGEIIEPATPAKMTGADILATAEAPMTPALRAEIERSAGGQAALARYDNDLSAVVSTVRDNIEQMKDEFGMVKPEDLAEYAASLDQFNPAMAPDVKRAISAFSEQVNKNQANVEQFKQQQKAQADKLSAAQDQAALESFNKYTAPLAGRGKEPPPPEAARLMDGGMTPSQVATKAAIDGMVDPIEADAYKSANVNRVARDIIGPDFDPSAFEGVTSAVADDVEVRANIESALADSYQKAQAGGGDIRTVMLADISRLAGIKDKEAQDALSWINETWDRINEYVGEQLSTQASTIREEQTASVKGMVSSAAASIASDAASFSAETFEPAFKAKTWGEAGDSKDGRRASLAGSFRDAWSSKVEEGFAMAPAGSISDMQEMYNRYANALNKPGEAELARQDETFAQIVAARNAYVESGMAIAQQKQTQFEINYDKAAADRARVAMQSRGGVDHYVTVPFGDQAINVPATAYSLDRMGMQVDENVANILINNADSKYVQEVVKNNTQGTFLTEAGAAELARMRLPPSDAVYDMYDEAVVKGVAQRIANSLPTDSVRQVLETTDLGAIQDMPTGAWMENEYSDKVVPIVEIASRIPSGRMMVDGVVRNVGTEENLKGLLNEIDTANKKTLGGSVPEGTESISAIINGDANLRNIYYNGGTPEARQRAVAAAYVLQRRSLQVNAVSEVAGFVNPSDGRANNANMTTALDTIYAAAGNQDSAVKQLTDIRDQMASASNFFQIEDFDRELRDLETNFNLRALRNSVNRYDSQLAKMSSAYGENYSSVEQWDDAALAKGAYLGGMNPDARYAQVASTVDNARQILDVYDSLVSARDESRRRIRREMSETEARPRGRGIGG